MGCDCGKHQDMTPAEKAECEKSAELEAPDLETWSPDQVYKFDAASMNKKQLLTDIERSNGD